MFYQNKDLVVKKKGGETIWTKIYSSKKLLYQLPNTRSDGKGFCLPKRLYFHHDIQTENRRKWEGQKKARDETYLMVLHMLLQFTQPSTNTYTTLIQPPHKSSQKQKDCRIECSKMIAIKQLSTFVDFSFLPKLHRESKKKEQTTKNDLTFKFLSQFMSAKVRYLTWRFFCWNKTYANFVRAWLRALGHKMLPNLIFVETILEWLVISFFEKMNNFSFSYIKNILTTGGML